jgi:hypothetical protein
MLTLADFRRGRKFRVIKPGCELNGELPSGGFGTGLRHTWESCVIPLSVGDVLTCNGPGLDRLRNGKVVQWRNENGEWMTYYSHIWPCTGGGDEPYVVYPDPTYLEPIEEPPEGKRRWWQRR